MIDDRTFDFIITFARLHGMTRDEATKEAERVLKSVSLEDVMHKKIGQFSKGRGKAGKNWY